MSMWKLNLRYIRIINACDRKQFVEFIDLILNLKGAFTRKRYLWNIMRGKEFYKNLAYYVIMNVRSDTEEGLEKAETAIHMVMATEKNFSIRENFIWNITKQVPLITADTILYLSEERLTHFLSGDRKLYLDEHTQPFLVYIRQLRDRIDELEDAVDLSSSIEM